MKSKNTIICGNSLNELTVLPTECVNLVYLDPPFFSKREYEIVSSDGKKRGFSDLWKGGIEEYLIFMREIFKECHRVLCKSGSLYIHCDWHASHYLKVELDKIFGYNKFRNEIIWKRHNAHNDTKQGAKIFGRVHDVILFYTKSNTYVWNAQYDKYPESYIKKYYKFTESKTKRKYAFGDCSGPGGRKKGNPYYEFLGVSRYWRFSKENMEKLYEEGRIVQTRKGSVPKLKRYLDEMPGICLQDMWNDFPSIKDRNECRGYPTQKPTRLVERIIEISTNPKDVVLDPFCGSGTTLIAATNLNRRFIGIDISKEACSIARERYSQSKKECIIEPAVYAK
jgi:DNA modification methylase